MLKTRKYHENTDEYSLWQVLVMMRFLLIILNQFKTGLLGSTNFDMQLIVSGGLGQINAFYTVLHLMYNFIYTKSDLFV
jgi:hypothetical protein